MLDGVSSATFVFPLFNFVLQTFRTGYELRSAQAETEDLLETIQQVVDNIKNAKDLQQKVSSSLRDQESEVVSRLIRNVERAMSGLEQLVEPARVDIEEKKGKVGGLSRIMWVMRDSTKVAAALGRLMVADQHLQTQIILMNQKLASIDQKLSPSSFSSPRNEHMLGPPPPYPEDTLRSMHERRQSLRLRRQHKRSSTQSVAMLPNLNNLAGYIAHNELELQQMVPSLHSAPRDTFVPAVLIETLPKTLSVDEVYELDSTEIVSPASGSRTSMSQTLAQPSWIANNYYTPTDYDPVRRVADLSLVDKPVPPLPPSARTADPPTQQTAVSTHAANSTWSIFGANGPRGISTSTPKSIEIRLKSATVPDSTISNARQIMKSETLIPGQKKPLAVRWIEPSQMPEGSPVKSSNEGNLGSENMHLKPINATSSPNYKNGGHAIFTGPRFSTSGALPAPDVDSMSAQPHEHQRPAHGRVRFKKKANVSQQTDAQNKSTAYMNDNATDFPGRTVNQWASSRTNTEQYEDPFNNAAYQYECDSASTHSGMSGNSKGDVKPTPTDDPLRSRSNDVNVTQHQPQQQQQRSRPKQRPSRSAWLNEN